MTMLPGMGDPNQRKKPSFLQMFAGGLDQLGAMDTQNRNQEHMMKVFAANPAYAQALYGAQNDQRTLSLQEEEVMRKRRQQEALKQLAGRLGGANLKDPTQRQSALAEYGAISGDVEPMFGIGRNIPSAIQEYQFFSNLSPDEQARYLQTKRANQVVNLGGTQAVVAPTGNIQQEFPVTPGPESLPDFKAAQTTATNQAELDVEKAANYPKVAAQVDANIGIIDEALNHPGLDKNFGKMGVLPNIPGSEASDAATYLEQIKGTAFLTAIGEMRGSGSISEKEGAAATAAVTRLQKAQSAESARKALMDLKDIMMAAKERAKPKQNQGAVSDEQFYNNIPRLDQSMIEGDALPVIPQSNGWSIKKVP